jgi:TolB-like protein
MVGPMRKIGILLILLIVVGFVHGCLGTGELRGTYTASLSPSNYSTVTLKSKQPSRMELIENLKKVKQFSFQENTSIRLNVTMKVGNTTKSEEVGIVYLRSGYVDFQGRIAEVNITTTTFPGGASTFMKEIITDRDVYVFIGGKWIKLTNGSLGISPSLVLNMTWRYNLVNFTLKYLGEKPYRESFENGTKTLYYNVTARDLREMSGGLLGEESNMSLNVTTGVLELRFVGTRLVGGRVGYRMMVHLWGERLGRRVDVYEVGSVYDEFTITDINVRKKVEVPASYEA